MSNVIHNAIAMALVEDGIDAFAFRHTRGISEIIVIRMDHHDSINIFTAYVNNNDTVIIGKSDRLIRAKFELASPTCFDQIKKWLQSYVEPTNTYAIDLIDNRLYFGDVLETWIKNTPGFHMFVDKGVVIG